LPIGKFHGVGPVTANKMKRLGIFTGVCNDFVPMQYDRRRRGHHDGTVRLAREGAEGLFYLDGAMDGERKALLDELRLHYLHAHQIAVRIERDAVKAAGVSWWAYQRFMKQHDKGD
jgi:hypothetical protein